MHHSNYDNDSIVDAIYLNGMVSKCNSKIGIGFILFLVVTISFLTWCSWIYIMPKDISEDIGTQQVTHPVQRR